MLSIKGGSLVSLQQQQWKVVSVADTYAYLTRHPSETAMSALTELLLLVHVGDDAAKYELLESGPDSSSVRNTETTHVYTVRNDMIIAISEDDNDRAQKRRRF
jgi:hypothetical protein